MKTVKYALFLMLTLCGFSAQAQMTEALSSLAIQGEMAREDYKAVNQGQRAVNRLQFQQDLAAVIAEIQTSNMGNYTGLSKWEISHSIKGVDWDVAEDGPGGFVIILNDIDGATCFICKERGFGAEKIEINSGNGCTPTANIIRMYFN